MPAAAGISFDEASAGGGGDDAVAVAVVAARIVVVPRRRQIGASEAGGTVECPRAGTKPSVLRSAWELVVEVVHDAAAALAEPGTSWKVHSREPSSLQTCASATFLAPAQSSLHEGPALRPGMIPGHSVAASGLFFALVVGWRALRCVETVVSEAVVPSMVEEWEAVALLLFVFAVIPLLRKRAS